MTRERIRATALISAALCLAGLLYLFATRHGSLDLWGRPLGTDFSGFYAAGRMSVDGHAPEAWNWGRHYAVQQAVHGSTEVDFFAWHYPPPFLLVASLLAMLPYGAALLAWQGTTLASTALLVRRILPGRDVMLVALAAPVVFVCLGHGQNGFLTASLLGGGLLLLDRRPLVAGLLFGCLVYKPQFALVVGPLLLVTGNWRAILGGILSSLALILLTLAIWGLAVWEAFLHFLPLARNVVVEGGAAGWEKFDSAMGMIRMWGGTSSLAYGVQAVVTLATLIALILVARRAAPPVRNAAAAAAALLSTPYVLDYDFVLLGIACAFILRDAAGRGFLRWEKSLLALAWIAPLCARQLAFSSMLPLAWATAAAIFILAIRRALVLDGAADALRRTWPSRHLHAASAR